ncbi:hypothetical protein HPB48_014697 [Haemaphysalis longicornis]|uniref:Uncharacterized protein n=1 Tax=Haemaphysalis longicornis TaxID=44386 RepID=A0A9J6GJ83_HAELO|nr:hypothetical protein HPB48_014697 [Haemaphysalis longicornis]
MRAELMALRSEIRKADTTLHEPDAQSPPLVKHKREEKNLPTTSPEPSHQQATVTPSDQQGLLPAPYATVQEVMDMNSRTVQAMQAATQQAATIPGDPQGPLPAAHATVQDVKNMEIRTIQALQATIEQAIQRSLQQHLPVLQQDIATQQQNFAGYIEERFARLEERLFALEDRHLRRLQKATTAEPTDLHMHQELPPDYDEDDCSPTDA